MELEYRNGKERVSDDSEVLWGSLMLDDSIHWDRKFQSNSLRGGADGKFNFNVYIQMVNLILTFSHGASGKEPTCQCRRCGFDSWARKTPWRRAWQPTPVFLPGESHGQRSLAGYSPWGCKESDRTEVTSRIHSESSQVIHLGLEGHILLWSCAGKGWEKA